MNYLELNAKGVEKTVEELNILLSNYHLYYQNLRNFHWNVTGQNFFDLHEKFEEMYMDARLKVDEIAERILTLRYRPVSLYSKYLQHAEIKEAEGVTEDERMIENILYNQKILISNMRRIIDIADESNDEGTVDMIAGFLGSLEKTSWMLDAWSATKLKSAKV